MIADREMCVLSGGVNSAILCGIISSLGHRLTLFSMGFGDKPDLGPDEGESLSAIDSPAYSDGLQTPLLKLQNTILSTTKE
jgi:asparagine synthase (glutamine-hydrolysing)